MFQIRQLRISRWLNVSDSKLAIPKMSLMLDGPQRGVKAQPRARATNLISGLRKNFCISAMLVSAALVGVPARSLASGSGQLPVGTTVKIRTVDAINSRQADVGQSYRCSVAEDVVVNRNTIVKRGSDCVLLVVETKKSGVLTGKSELQLQLSQVRIGSDLVDVNSEVASQESAGKGKGTAKKGAIGATAGAILGGILGGGKGAAIGAAAGGSLQVWQQLQSHMVPRSKSRLRPF